MFQLHETTTTAADCGIKSIDQWHLSMCNFHHHFSIKFKYEKNVLVFENNLSNMG
jgi:hypothetical protein